MKCKHFLRGPKSLLTLYQIINKTWFPLLADEIAKPRPDMNVKVAAFTVIEKSSNTDMDIDSDNSDSWDCQKSQ